MNGSCGLADSENRTFNGDTRAEADSEMLKAWKTKFEAEARNA
jgi:hypothetical protein